MKTKNKNVDILIVHLNGEKIIRNCLNSIYKNTRDNFSVYVLLNNSSDNSNKMISKEFPKVRILSTSRTIGFAEACNILAKASKSELITFLNNDTIVERGWLEELVKTMKRHPNCIGCQPKVKSYFKRKNFEYAGAAGGFIDKYGYPFCRGRLFNSVERDNGQYDNETRIFWASGACFLVNRNFFNSLGGFDKDFFMYAEETDFCWRANLLGKEVWYSPKSVIYHMGSYTIKKEKVNLKKEYLITRNHLILLLKNESLYTIIRILPLRIFLEIVAAIRYFPTKTLASLMSALSLPYIYLTKIANKRKFIQANRKVSDKELYNIVLNKSIVLEYFLNGKKTFDKLNFNN